MIVLRQRREGLKRAAVILSLGAQRTLAFPGAERAGHGRNDGKHGDNERKGGPAALVLFVSAGEQHAEIGDHGYHDDRQPVKAEGGSERAEGSVQCPLLRIFGQCGNHAPERDVTQGIEHVKDDEHRNEQNDKPCLIHVDETEQSGEHHEQKDRADEASNKLPRAKPADSGVGVIDKVAEQWVDEDLSDADEHNGSGDNANELGRDVFIHSGEKGGSDVYHEIGAHHVVEGSLAKTTEGVGHLLSKCVLWLHVR